MGKEFRPDPNFVAWGPFIKDNYYIQPVTREDMIIAGTSFGFSILFAIVGIVFCTRHTRQSSHPLKSPFIWMIWIELVVCVIIAIEVLLYLMKLVRPSFYFFMSILFVWSIQVQLLLQIIINRIRVIVPDPRKGKQIMVGVAVLVTLINISVSCIWMPARLQINHQYIQINEYWDRIEKFIFFLIDGSLNWYFIRVVKTNLVKNGLKKYDKLVRFNQRIIVISLFMDIALIAAMSTPNGFVYAMFHSVAYLVKLNIELSMAGLIKKIAMSSSCRRESVSSVFNVSNESRQSNC